MKGAPKSTFAPFELTTHVVLDARKKKIYFLETSGADAKGHFIGVAELCDLQENNLDTKILVDEKGDQLVDVIDSECYLDEKVQIGRDADGLLVVL